MGIFTKRKPRAAANLTRVYKKTTTKSRAGIKYIQYVPFLKGTINQGPNRKSRRIQPKLLKRLAKKYGKA